MAPEQAKGKIVDKRADIWAFGVVLYEMLTGERLYEHDDVTETLAAVVMKAPELERVPVEVRRLLKKCLEKDPKRRLRDIGDVWELLEAEPAAPAEGRPQAKARATWFPWVVSGALLLALSAAVAWILRPSPEVAITRLAVLLGEGQRFTNIGRLNVAISPDGTRMVYVANQRLYLRSMQELEARAIPGTDSVGGVVLPAFSPDGKSLVFYTLLDLMLKRVAISGGAPVTICQNIAPTSLSWGPDGIVFTQSGKDILRVAPNGGKPEPLVSVKDNEQVQGPQMLPGGEAIMFALAPGASDSDATWDRAQIVVQTLKSGARKTLIDVGADARYLPTGHLVYALNGVLFAQPFDLRRLETTGGPVSIVEGVGRTYVGGAQFAFSRTGSLIYLPGPDSGRASSQGTLALVSRKGEVEALKHIPQGAYSFPRVSRDGKRVAYQIDDGKESSIWIYELSGATAPRGLTLPGTGANRYAIWSSDGKRVAFQSNRDGDLGIFWQLADGAGTAERLTKPEKGISDIPDSWSPDGRTFSFTEQTNETVAAVWTYSLRDKKATLFAEAQGSHLGRSVFSPDGRWVAYQEIGSPASRIYVQPFPPTATRYQIPQDQNSHHPLWSADGKELFYTAGPGSFGSVSVTTQPSLSFGSPVRTPAGFDTQRPGSIRPYDILPDGEHFIGVVPVGQTQTGTAAQIQVVLNWFEEVKQKVPVR
jgi:Tol biopolymer transport system component